MQPLIVCGDTIKDASGNVTSTLPACDFSSLIVLVNHLINDLVILAALFATAGLAYAGFKLMTSGGDEGAWKAAKATAWSVLKGFLWILVAWLLVYTITNGLLAPGYSLLGAPTN